MNDEDANIIINIILSADGNCPYCAASLLKKFIEHYPEYERQVHDKFIKKFKSYKLYDVDEIWNDTAC